eukprot:jgi/Mesen1/8186/ME000044S07449
MELYRRIDARCEEMVTDGMLREAAYLLDVGIGPDSNPPSRAIGYRQGIEYLERCRQQGGRSSESDLLEFLAAFQQASRNFAKRQHTWFRGEKLYTWLDASLPPDELADLIVADYGAPSPEDGARGGRFEAPQSSGGKGREEAREAANKRSKREGKEMKSYRTKLEIFNDSIAVQKVLEWVRATQGGRHQPEIAADDYAKVHT